MARMLGVDEVLVLRMSRDELRHETAVIAQRHALGPDVVEGRPDERGRDTPAAVGRLDDRVPEHDPRTRVLVHDGADHLPIDQRLVAKRFRVIPDGQLRGLCCL